MKDEHLKLVNTIESLSTRVQEQAEDLATLRKEHAEEIATLKEQIQAGSELRASTPGTRLASRPDGTLCRAVHNFDRSLMLNLDSYDTNSVQERGKRSLIPRYCKRSAKRARMWNETPHTPLNETPQPSLNELTSDSDETRESPRLSQIFRSLSRAEVRGNARVPHSEQQDQWPHEQERGDLPERFERSSATTRSEISSRCSLSHSPEPLNQSDTTSIDIVPLPLLALKPQRGLSLEEYLVQSGDDLVDRQSRYEKKFVEAFVEGMEDEQQKATLRERLDEEGTWTWKKAFEEGEKIVKMAFQEKILGKAKPSRLRTPNRRKVKPLRIRTPDGRFARKV